MIHQDDEDELANLRRQRRNRLITNPSPQPTSETKDGEEDPNSSKSQTQPSSKVSTEEATEDELRKLQELFPFANFGGKSGSPKPSKEDNIAVHEKHSRKHKFAYKFDPTTQRTSIAQATSENRMATGGEDGPVVVPISSNSDSKFDPSGDSSSSQGLSASSTLPSSSSGVSDPMQIDRSLNSNPYDFPISHEILLVGHTRMVSALSLDPAGGRLISGALDNTLKMWDFAGMDKTLKSFREFNPVEGHPVLCAKFSTTGDRFLVCSGGQEVCLYDRDGYKIGQTVRGDMYLREMKHTFGHVANAIGCGWHPKDKSTFMSWSFDGTMRIWDVEKMDKNKDVAKIKSTTGQRIKCTAGTYSRDGKMLFGAGQDGSIHMWGGSQMVRPKKKVKAHEPYADISCLTIASDNRTLLSRGGDHTLKVWDVRKFKQPVKVYEDLRNDIGQTDAIFCPKNQFIITTTSSPKHEEGHGELVFIHRKEQEIVQRIPISDASAVKVIWHSKLNQIVVAGADNAVRVFYDPNKSRKGALLCAGRQTARAHRTDFVGPLSVGKIINPHALKTMRDEPSARQKKLANRKDPIKSRRPELPVNGPSTGGRVGTQSFAQYVAKQAKLRQRNTLRDEDPREQLLKWDSKAKAEPLFSTAYSDTQPTVIFDNNEYDDDDNIIYKPKTKRRKIEQVD